MQSRSLLLISPGRLEWQEAETLPPRDAELLVQTVCGAISIGSELPLYRGNARSAALLRYPRMTGYESIGRVLACGPLARSIREGDRVVAFYGHRTHAIIPEAKAIAVPDHIDDATALLAILSCDAAKGVQKLRPWIGDPVLITGAGVMGLLTVYLVHASGCRAIDVVEPLAHRRELALRMGARVAVAPEAVPATNGLDPSGYAAGFECSSRNRAFALLQQQMRPAGRICVLSDGNNEALELSPAFHAKELSVTGSSDGWDYQRHALWWWEQTRRQPAALAALFDYECAAEELPRVFERLAASAIDPLKVFVRYAG